MYGLGSITVAGIFHLLDLATGVIGAVREKNLQSSKMRDGLFKKIGFLCCYTLAVLVDTQSETVGIDLGVNILPLVIFYAVSTEIISIIENIHRINPDILPEKLTELFHIKTEGGAENAEH